MRACEGWGGESAKAATEAQEYSQGVSGRIIPVELDVTEDNSVKAAISRVGGEQGKLDVVIHNAGHMTFGPLEAFTPEQLLDIYDINAVGPHRINRTALPILRKQGKGA